MSAMKPALRRAVVWSVVFFAICAAAVPVLKRLLPQRVELIWQTHVDIAPDARVSIEVHRRLHGNYSTLQPIDNAQLSLDDARSPHPPIHIGPNDSICLYRDSKGATIRGAAPPDAIYTAVWLKENGAPQTAAHPISNRIAQAFDNDQLARGTPGADWTTTQSSRTNPLAWIAAVSVMVLVWVTGVVVSAIPARNTRE